MLCTILLGIMSKPINIQVFWKFWCLKSHFPLREIWAEIWAVAFWSPGAILVLVVQITTIIRPEKLGSNPMKLPYDWGMGESTSIKQLFRMIFRSETGSRSCHFKTIPIWNLLKKTKPSSHLFFLEKHLLKIPSFGIFFSQQITRA